MCVLGASYTLSGVSTGVHYPFDVFAGARIGVMMVRIVTQLGFIAQAFAERVIAFARQVYSV